MSHRRHRCVRSFPGFSGRLALLGFVVMAMPASAEITGTVVIEGTGIPGTPIEGAQVQLRADAGSPVVLTDALGRFSLPVNPANPVEVSAAVVYDPLADAQYNTGAVDASNGDDVVIRLREIPQLANTTYTPIKAVVPAGCGDCHGEQLAAWSPSAHARSATNVWVRDLYSGDGTAGGAAGYVFQDVHPAEPGFCATCHAPVAEAQDPGTVFYDEVSGDAALEGVTCSACHHIDHVSDNVTALHLVGDPEPNSTFRFPLDGIGGAATHEYVWGPLPDVDYAFMRAAYQPVYAESKYCASCHEYVNPANGTPGQTTYSEWLDSSFATPGAEYRTCQDCHMPEATKAGPIADPVIGTAPVRPASQRHDHGFNARPVGVPAVELAVTAGAVGGDFAVNATVSNTGAGHSFPTGISLRNAIVLVRASISGVELVQTSGPTIPAWANDDEPGEQAGDWGGYPGLGLAKVLSGVVNGERTDPVLFFDADTVLSNTALEAGESRTAAVRFALPPGTEAGDVVDVDVQLLYRRAWRALVVTKGWTEAADGGPIEQVLAFDQRSIELGPEDLAFFADGFESGDVSAWTASVP